MSSNSSSLLPKIDEDNILDAQGAKLRVTEILDILEGKVEKLRKEAASLEEDKDNILARLDSIRTAHWIQDLAHCTLIIIQLLNCTIILFDFS